jgi:hypothetical protein
LIRTALQTSSAFAVQLPRPSRGKRPQAMSMVPVFAGDLETDARNASPIELDDRRVPSFRGTGCVRIFG